MEDDCTCLGPQYLWAAPLSSFTPGCGDPTACGFTNPCDISLLCDYTDTDGDESSTARRLQVARRVCRQLQCQRNGSRYLVTTTACTNADAVNFDSGANTDDGSCQFEIVFRVNASNITGDGAMDVAGSFNGFDPATAMTEMGYGVWETSRDFGCGFLPVQLRNGAATGEHLWQTAIHSGCWKCATAPMTLDAACFGECGPMRWLYRSHSVLSTTHLPVRTTEVAPRRLYTDVLTQMLQLQRSSHH